MVSDGAPTGIVQVSFLCAGCGVEVRMDYFAPAFGLCEACEERVASCNCSPQHGERVGGGDEY